MVGGQRVGPGEEGLMGGRVEGRGSRIVWWMFGGEGRRVGKRGERYSREEKFVEGGGGASRNETGKWIREV